MNQIDYTDLFIKTLLVFLAIVLVVFVSFAGVSIYNAIQKDNEYQEWAKQCNNAGKVVVEAGRYDHCMSWEEIKEKGIVFEAG